MYKAPNKMDKFNVDDIEDSGSDENLDTVSFMLILSSSEIYELIIFSKGSKSQWKK
jgi:hypothetical protein